MRYYSEEKMKDLRSAFDGQVLGWPGVTTKKMFGCPCYRVGGKLFAFLVTNGVVITCLPDRDRNRLARTCAITAFEAGGKRVRAWAKVPVRGPRDLTAILPFVRSSYQAAREGT